MLKEIRLNFPASQNAKLNVICQNQEGYGQAMNK